MALTRLDEPSLLTDQVFVAIRAGIMSGAIAPGSRLRLRELAGQLGTSPMPVREAIGRLEQSGLVVRVPNRGAVVVELTPGELVDVYDTRVLLEVEATRRGSAVVRDDDVARMRAAHEQMLAAVTAGRVSEALDLDEAMLAILYAAGGNPVLLGMVRDLWRRCRPYKLLGADQGPEPEEDVWSEQGRLIEAAAAHDVEAAVAVTRRSLDGAGRRIRALLPTGPG
jgi:DNA-binding GntR family transcriptional regulator